ncbi:MAG TPA: hypothetical protein VII00_01530, partial [bacterium]
MKKLLNIFVLITIMLWADCRSKPAAQYTLRISASPQTVSADLAMTKIIAELVNSSNEEGVDGKNIQFTSTTGSIGGVVGLGGGRYSVILSGIGQISVNPVTVTALYEGLRASIDISITPGGPSYIDLYVDSMVSADVGAVILTARIYDYNNNPVTDADPVFISSYGVFDQTAKDGLGAYATVLRGLYDVRESTVKLTVKAAQVQRVAEIILTPGVLKGFLISHVLDPQFNNEPFALTAVAVDKRNNLLSGFNDSVNIVSSTNLVTVSPAISSPFVNGLLYQENVAITGIATGMTLTLNNGAGSKGTTNPFDVIAIPAVDHFDIAPVASPVTAGSPLTISVVAKDAGGNTVTDFHGTVNITDTTSTIAPAVSQKFVNGVLNQQVSITKAQTGVTITVVGSTGGSGVSNSFNVVTDALDHFTFETINSPIIVNSSFPVTVTAVDAYENQVTSFAGTASFSDLTGTILPATSFNFVNGVLLQQVKVSMTALADVIKVDDGAGHTGESNPFEVSTIKVDHFNISSISTPQTAGASFTITVEAKNASNATVTEFNGTITISDLTKTIDPEISPPFVSGVLTQNVKIYKPITNNTITVSWNGKTATSNTFNVDPGVLNRFVFSPISSPRAAGQVFSITLEAVDLYGNRTGFNGAVSMKDLTGKLTPATSNNFINGLLTQN